VAGIEDGVAIAIGDFFVASIPRTLLKAIIYKGENRMVFSVPQQKDPRLHLRRRSDPVR
jgi:hypothetical protein